MKKFIAFGVALAVLLFSFVPAMGTATEMNGVSVCSDLKPNPDPHN